MLQKIPLYYDHIQSNLELAAIVATQKLLQVRPKTAIPVLFQHIIDTFGNTAIKEYLDSIKIASYMLNEDELKQLVELAKSMLTKSMKMQIGASSLLMSLPMYAFSREVANELAHYASSMPSTYGISFMLHISSLLDDNVIIPYLQQLEINDRTALTALKYGTTLLEPRFSSFKSLLSSFISKVATSATPKNRRLLPSTLAKCPQLVRMCEIPVKTACSMIANDSDREVRKKFIKKFNVIYQNSSPKLQSHLISLMVALMQDPEPLIQETILNSSIFPIIAVSNSQDIEFLLKYCKQFINKWRLYKGCLDALLQLPDELFNNHIIQIIMMTDEALKLNPHALRSAYIKFYRIIINRYTNLSDLLTNLVFVFGTSKSFAHRQCYIDISVGIIDLVSADTFASLLFPRLFELAEDEIISVQYRFLVNTPKLLQVFRDHALFQKLVNVIGIFRNNRDPHIQELYQNCLDQIDRLEKKEFIQPHNSSPASTFRSGIKTSVKIPTKTTSRRASKPTMKFSGRLTKSLITVPQLMKKTA